MVNIAKPTMRLQAIINQPMIWESLLLLMYSLEITKSLAGTWKIVVLQMKWNEAERNYLCQYRSTLNRYFKLITVECKVNHGDNLAINFSYEFQILRSELQSIGHSTNKNV